MNEIQIALLSVYVALFGGYYLSRFLIRTQSKPQGTPSINEGKFESCVHALSCVNTQEQKEYNVEPLSFESLGSVEEIRDRILTGIKNYGRTKIVKEEKNYIHAEFYTGVFNFVDDLQIYIDTTDKILHARSASRLGSRDWGVNKTRVETLFSHVRGEIEIILPDTPVPREKVPKIPLAFITNFSILFTALIAVSPLIHRQYGTATIVIAVILAILCGLFTIPLLKAQKLKPQYWGSLIWVILVVALGIAFELYILVGIGTFQLFMDGWFYQQLEKVNNQVRQKSSNDEDKKN